MKQKTYRRALALLLSVLLVAGLMPSTLGLFATTASGAPGEEAAVYIMDAADLDVATIGTEAIATDTPVGTNGFFTIMAPDKKNAVKQLNEPVDTPLGKYSQALQLGGQVKSTGAAALKIEITKPSKVTLYAAVKAVNATKYHLQYIKDGGTAVTYYTMENDPAVCQKVELNLDEPGTYYLGGNNGGNFFYIEVKEQKPSNSFDVTTVDETLFNADAKDSPLKADSTIGTNGFFGVLQKGDKVCLRDRSSFNHSYNGKNYPKALTLNGGAKSSGQSCIEFTTTATSRVTILAAAKSSGASTLELYNKADFSKVVTFADGLIEDTIQEYVANNLPAGTYYIGGTNGADIFDIRVETVGVYSMDANDIDDALIDNDNAISEDVQVGTDDYFTVSGTGKKIKFMTATNGGVEFNKKTYTKRIQLTGKPNYGTGQTCIKLNVAETARITIVAAAKGASAVGKGIGIAKVGDTTLTSMGTLGEVDALQEYILDVVKPGEYYITSEAGADIYEITVEYDALPLATSSWDDVAAPVLGDITVDADGNFVVPFTAVIDKTEGAEKVYIVMYEDGKEMATAEVAKQADSVTMTPIWSGNFSFEAIAVRTGEAWKRSEKKTYGDYTLAVRKPVIVAEQNRGGGKYYVDWFNLSEADSYAVAVKQGTGDYSTVAENLTTAHYELTGLSAGEYTVKIMATRNSDGFQSNYEKTIQVTDDTQPKWYVAIFGSSQETNAVITQADGTKTTYAMSTADNAPIREDKKDAPDITNTTGTITLEGSTSGKISDGEEGFSYYYTYVDPNTENFKLSAKFKITSVNLEPDNQTGFGLIATDMTGINFFGAPDYYHKLYNEVSALFWYAKAPRSCMRIVSGYSDPDTSNADGVDRVMEETRFQSDPNLKFEVGKEVTFSIEKTNDKWIVTCNGESQEYANTALLSTQEDGSLCIGVMTSRKVSIEASEITYTTSPSTGVSGVEKDARVTPNATVYSTGTTGSTAYEYIYAANTAGTLVVKLDGKEIYNQAIAGDTAIRVPVTVQIGNNTIESEFTPSGTTATLTNTDVIKKTSVVECRPYGKEGDTIVVAPDGTADGDGSAQNPLDLATIVKYAQPGQTILLKDGAYTKGVTIPRSVCGTADKMITMVPENDGKVVFDTAAIRLEGSYWHIYGLEVKDVSSGNGILVAGNHNIVEMCTIHGSTNTGLQISRSGSAENKVGIEGELWPSYNLIKNCESYDNCDAGRNDADGFAAKLTSGKGNVFYGCIAHHNIDDGWDLFAKTISGEIGAVTIENCVAYNNGWLTTDDTSAEGYNYGEGNGFKLGGGYLNGGHVLRNCISFANGAKGITSNSCPDCEVYDCTNFGNSVIKDKNAYNIGLNKKVSAQMGWKASGLISMSNGNTTEADLFPVSLYSATNYISNKAGDAYNTEGVAADSKWFKSVDVSKVPTRNTDGTINMDGLLELLETAPADSGARLDVTSDKAKSVKPAVGTPIEPTVYEIIEGKDQVVEKDDEGNVTIKANGDIDKFVSVFVDGELVDPENYTVTAGSTVITFKAEYLKTLSEGTHTVTINYTDGAARTTLIVQADDKKPDDSKPDDSKPDDSKPPVATGDTTPVVWLCLLALLSGSLTAYLVLRFRKREE